MATPTGDSYTAGSGEAILAGNAFDAAGEESLSHRLSSSHPLYASVVRGLAGNNETLRMLDSTGGTDHAAAQSEYIAVNTVHESGVEYSQGIATDGTYFYGTNTANIKKNDVITGALVDENLTPFASLPDSQGHQGDCFVDGGKLYVPSTNATGFYQKISVYNTSDLSYIEYFDISANAIKGAAAICKSHDNTIYLASYDQSETPTAAQNTIVEFNISTGAFIRNITLPNHISGSQGITFDGEFYYITSHVSPTLIYRYTKDFSVFKIITLQKYSGEIEGVCVLGDMLIISYYGFVLREIPLKPNGLRLTDYIDTVPVKFIDEAVIPESGSLIVRLTPHRYFQYNQLINNKDALYFWESWIYGSSELAWRLNGDASRTRTGFDLGPAGNEYLLMFSWEKSGSNVTIYLGVDGSIVDSDTTAWKAPPVDGLWLSDPKDAVTSTDTTFRDIIVYDKALSVSEWSDLSVNFDSVYNPREFGVLGSEIPSAGPNGAGYLYNDLTLPADANKEVRGQIVTWPSAGTLKAYEDSSFEFSGAPDGNYSFEYQLYVDGVAVGATQVVLLSIGAAGALTVGSQDQSQYFDQPSLSSAANLSSDSINQAQQISAPVMLQHHILTANEAGQEQSLDRPMLRQAYVLLAADSLQGQGLSSVNITQSLALTADGESQNQSLSAPALIQQNTIAANQLEQQQAVNSVSLSTTGTVGADDLKQAQTINAVQLATKSDISALEINQAQSITGPALGASDKLSVSSLSQVQSFDSAVLVVAGGLTAQSAEQLQSLEESSLLQKNTLAVDALVQNQALGNVSITFDNALSVLDVEQIQGVTEPTLDQHGVIAVDSLTQAQVESLVMFGGAVIGVLDGKVMIYSALDGKVEVTEAISGNVTIN